MDIEGLGLPNALTARLRAGGFTTAQEVAGRNAREIMALPGVGPGAVLRVEAALRERLDTGLAEDPFAPYECAREQAVAGDAKLTDLWLCDACAEQFQGHAFSGTAPEFESPTMGGVCVNCVESKPDVRLRQWFLCGNCGRVAQSFGRSVIAARELGRVWNETYAEATGVALVEVDPPVLNPRNQATIAAKIAAVDFEGRDTQTGNALFGIEMKTGQGGLGAGAVKPMAQFQLDCSDCDDIATVAERENLPVYLVHAQVVDRAEPPTRRFVPVGYWWADPYGMAESCVDVRTRTREIRPAAYYDVHMFRPLSELADALNSGAIEELRESIRGGGRFPPFYPNQPRFI